MNLICFKACGGEMSAHHYFRDFAYCDNRMIPWLFVAELIAAAGKPLTRLVSEREAAFPCGGEINYKVADPKAAMRQIEAHFASGVETLDRTDGICLEFAEWRFNPRSSNSESLLRLNVESLGKVNLVAKKVMEIEAVMGVAC
jgi:phosphomannomutase